MKVKEVPQDKNEIYEGYGTKATYAVDEHGQYTIVRTSGWDVEEVVLRDVLNDFAGNTAEAKKRFLEGETSPIEYFMNKNLMDLPALSYGVGIRKWRIRRHMKPSVFGRLRGSLLKLYAGFFKTTVENFTTLKEEE